MIRLNKISEAFDNEYAVYYIGMCYRLFDGLVWFGCSFDNSTTGGKHLFDKINYKIEYIRSFND